MEKLYIAMGAQRSYLGASTGPIRSTVDGTAKYVNYTGGRIWWTSATGASAMTSFVLERYAAFGGPVALGYPKGARTSGLIDGGWIQLFQKGAMVDSASTSTHSVHGYRWSMWRDSGRENGAAAVPGRRGGGPARRAGSSASRTAASSTATTTPRAIVHNFAWTAWLAARPRGGPARLPDRRPGQLVARGTTQPFQHGGLWGLTYRAVFGVWGAVLDAWLATGGAGGSHGFPTAHVVDNGDGTLTGVFENGTITA